jgi:hypothetical protein
MVRQGLSVSMTLRRVVRGPGSERFEIIRPQASQRYTAGYRWRSNHARERPRRALRPDRRFLHLCRAEPASMTHLERRGAFTLACIAAGINYQRPLSQVPAALGLLNHARNGKVSAETCDASRPTPNAQAAGRQEPPCSASTPPPTQLPAQPKPRSVLHETLQSCAQAPALPRSISEIHAFLTPINSLTPYFQHPDEFGLDCVKTGAG